MVLQPLGLTVPFSVALLLAMLLAALVATVGAAHVGLGLGVTVAVAVALGLGVGLGLFPRQTFTLVVCPFVIEKLPV